MSWLILIHNIFVSTIAHSHELSSSLDRSLSITYAKFPSKIIYLTSILIARKINSLDDCC